MKQRYIAYGNRGNVRHVRGELDAAIADYTKAIDLDRDYTAAYTGRGMMYEKAGPHRSCDRGLPGSAVRPAEVPGRPMGARHRAGAFAGASCQLSKALFGKAFLDDCGLQTGYARKQFAPPQD